MKITRDPVAQAPWLWFASCSCCERSVGARLVARQKPLQGEVFARAKEHLCVCVVLEAAAEFGFQRRILSFLPDLSHFESLRGSSHSPREKKGEFLVGLFIRKCCL